MNWPGILQLIVSKSRRKFYWTIQQLKLCLQELTKPTTFIFDMLLSHLIPVLYSQVDNHPGIVMLLSCLVTNSLYQHMSTQVDDMQTFSKLLTWTCSGSNNYQDHCCTRFMVCYRLVTVQTGDILLSKVKTTYYPVLFSTLGTKACEDSLEWQKWATKFISND